MLENREREAARAPGKLESWRFITLVNQAAVNTRHALIRPANARFHCTAARFIIGLGQGDVNGGTIAANALCW